MLSPITAAALEPDLDFKIADEASYQSFRDAVSKTEYVRNAYVQDPKPRVIGAVAGLVHYTTFNPLASDTQLVTFLTDYNAKLAAHALEDADLQRGSHLVSAVRFELPLSGVLALDGTNTNLGEEIAIFLGIDVPPPTGFESNKRRSVRFEQARLRALSESPAWANALTVGFSGQDLLGDPNPHLAGVLQTYLEGEGYSPFAPICGGCADPVGDALATLPASYVAYDALPADPFAANGIWDTVVAGFTAINLESVDRVQELADILDNAPPSLVEAVANANDPTFVTQRQDEYLANLAKVAHDRAVINVNALLLAQSQDDGTRGIAEKARRFASIQLAQNKGWAAAAGGVRMLGGVATLAYEASKGKKRDPVKLLGGAVNAVTGALGLGEVFGTDVDELTAEQEMLDQITEMRVQLVEVQLQLNDRFDRIETQLNVVFLELIDNFAELGTQVGALGDTLDVLEYRMAQANAKLDRIEDALWAILESNLEGQLAFETNVSLAYRETVGFEFPYEGPKPSFFAVNSDMFTYATTLADGPWAGDELTNMLTVADAANLLNGPNIGRQLNDLRVFPTQPQLGLPAPLFSERVPAPSLWTQSASVYAQIARENPWYFANQYENELQQGGPSDLDNIISKGEDLDELALNARDPQLFDALFDAWGTELATMSSVINTFAFDTPAILDSVIPAGSYTNVAISGDYAFVIEEFYGLRVINISDPANLFIVGNLPGSNFFDIAIRGDMAYVAAFDNMRVIDISDPTAPFIVVTSDVPTPGGAVDITISGDMAYVSIFANRVQLIYIGDGFGGALTFGFVDMPNRVNSVVASGDYAFVAVHTVGLQVIDVSDPFSPFLVVGATVGNTTFNSFNVAVSGDLVFMTDGLAGLRVIDISDPTAPLLIDTVDTGFILSVFTSGDLAFLGAGPVGMHVMSISDPTGPFFVVGTVDAVTPPGTPGGLGGNTRDIAISGNLAFMIDSYAGLVAIELSDAQDWQDVLDELPTIEVGGIYLSESLLGYQKLIDAYITLGMPELMEESPIVRAALRSDATKGELAVGPVDEIILGYISNPDVTPLTWSQVPANLQLLRDEVDAVIGNESVGHGYVDYMLAELEHLKDNARKLAIDDTYYTPFGVPLTVVAVPMATPLSGFDTGLLANDVYQRLRNIQVDLLFNQEPEYVAPLNGSLTSLGADGSFVYTPDPGFSGPDFFTYRTFSDMADPAAPTFADCDTSLVTACSEPATVRIIVQEVFVIQNTNDAGAGSLRDAVTNASGGALLRFDAALDDQPILLTSQLNLTKDVTIDASTLPNGLTLDGGGVTRVMHIDSGVVATLTGLTITGGSGGNGGGIENAGGILNLVDVSLVANNSAGYGGGIINFGGIVTATNTTIANNVAVFGGGGLYNGNTVTTVFTLINSTLAGNTGETAGGGGGGIRNFLGAVNLIHTTVVGNDSPGNFGGGIQNGGGTLSVENSIIAGNTAFAGSADFYSNTTVLTAGQSLIGDHEGVQAEFPIGPFAGTALNPVLPMLGPLADNGGPTQTMLPMPGSPAIDSALLGTIASPTTDQRGEARPGEPNNDIGSVEVPEPSSLLMLGVGCVALAGVSGRRRKDISSRRVDASARI